MVDKVAHDEHPEFAALIKAGYQWATNMDKENTPYTVLISEIQQSGYDVQVSEFAFDIYGDRLDYMVSVWERKKED